MAATEGAMSSCRTFRTSCICLTCTLLFSAVGCDGGGGGSGSDIASPPPLATVFVTTAVAGSGSITPPTAYVPSGQTTSFTITPNTGYKISSVSGCGGALADNIYTTGPITQTCIVSVSFDRISYIIIGNAGLGGSVIPRTATVLHGAQETFTLLPDPLFRIAGVSGCSGTLEGNTFTTDPIVGECTLDVIFVRMGALSDTGQFHCSDGVNPDLSCPVSGFPGQDGEYGRDALARSVRLPKVGGGEAGFDFTKLGANGEPLAIQNREWSDGGHETDGLQWSCVRDNFTGLVWEVKTTEGLRNKNHIYTWYSSDPNTNGGSEGAQDGGFCSGSRCDTQGYVQAVNELGLCGASDWRMPTRMELISIRHLGQERGTPTIDLHYFPNTADDDYWSGSSLPNVTSVSPIDSSVTTAYASSFTGGWGSLKSKSDQERVRLVRGGD